MRGSLASTPEDASLGDVAREFMTLSPGDGAI